MPRAIKVSRVGLATFGVLVIACFATTALVMRSARGVARGKPYCIQVADGQSDYRPDRMLFDLSVDPFETQDIALMNQYKMLEAVREAVGGKMPDGLDQIWYSEVGGYVFFDFTQAITTGSDELG